MPGLALLSPINEVDELSPSPYRARFSYARYPGQRSPIGLKSPSYHVQDTAMSSAKFSPDMSMDDLWIYDCYISEDATSPQAYPHSPSTPSHNRSISLPASTANFIPPNNIPLIKEPAPSHLPPVLDVHPRSLQQEPMLDFEDDPAEILAYSGIDVSAIDTSNPYLLEFPEYSPLEQEVLSIWEVMDQLASAVDEFSGVELILSYAAAAAEPIPDMDEDVAFWFIEALNLLVGDCTEVAMDLMKFGQSVEELLVKGQERVFPSVSTVSPASFSEQDVVSASAASIPQQEVAEALAALEASTPSDGRRRPRDRPPSLKLSTSDAVLLQAHLPRARLQSVGAVGRFAGEDNAKEQGKDAILRKHRGYVIIGDETPIEDSWSAKSVVDYDAVLPSPQIRVPSPLSRAESEQSAIPRPLSSLPFDGKAAKRPPFLAFPDSISPTSRSSHYTSSTVSSLFTGLPRSSFTTTPSPRSSTRQSFSFDKIDLRARFPASTGNIKKMFSNMFKRREGMALPRPSLPRPFGKRTEATGSIDATLSAIALSGMTSPPLRRERDPFAALPQSPAPFVSPPSSAELSPLDGYSSMFNSLKAASRYPTQPLFGGVEES